MSGELPRQSVSPAVPTVQGGPTAESGTPTIPANVAVSGDSLCERLRHGRLPLDDALQIGRSLLRELQSAHRAGKLHRAVSPTNILLAVNTETDEPPARLVAFDGNSGTVPAESSADSLTAARYMSPEQTGSLEYEVGEASDLYACGLVLWECLAGRPAFEASDLSSVLLAHMTQPVPELQSLNADTPRVLDDILQRMIRKDPRDRYQSAKGVLADWDAVIAARTKGDVEPTLVVGQADHRETLTEPAFVGRQHEMQQVKEQLEDCRFGASAAVVVESESGQGKTRFLAEVSRRAVLAGFQCYRGQGTAAASRLPFQLFDGVVDTLLELCESQPTTVEHLRKTLGDAVPAVTAALPRLAEILPTEADMELGPEAFGENRTVQALVRFLNALSINGRPAFVVLDDCQWADDLTVRVIAQWLETTLQTDEHHGVLLVAGYRAEEVTADFLLRSMSAQVRVTLNSLLEHETRRLLESMAGPLPDEAVAIVWRLSKGSPFLASAVLRGLVEAGALLPDQTGWRVEPLAMKDLQSSNAAAAVLLKRIELLADSTALLLSIGAVLGKEFDLSLAAELAGLDVAESDTVTAHAAGLPTEHVMTAVEEARRRNLVWVKPDGKHCVFLHDKLRESLLDRLSVKERKQLHLQAAERIAELDADRVFDLAYHFDAADKPQQAFHYAIAAAERARTQHALEIAEQQYNIACRAAEHAEPQVRYHVWEGLGHVLLLRGRYDDAEQALHRADELATDGLSRAEIRGKLGELAFKRGQMETATQAFEQALRLLGRFVPRSRVILLLMLVWETVVQVFHTLLPTWLVGRRQQQPTRSERLTFHLHSRLAHGYWFVRSQAHVLWTHLRGFNLAERYPPTAELAQAYSEHAPAMSLVPLFRRGIRYAQRSLAIRKSLGDLWGQGQSLHYLGVVLYTAARFGEAIQKSREAVRLLQRTGDFWEVHIAHYQLAAALYRLGRLEEAVVEAKKIHHSGMQLGDAQASGISLDVWSRACAGEIPALTVATELERPRIDVQGTAQTMLAEGVRLLQVDAPAEAAAVFQQAWQISREAGVLNTYVAPNLVWWVTALRQQIEALPGYGSQRKSLLAQARKLSGKAVRVARRFPNDLPHALREAACVAALRGHYRRAEVLFERSLHHAQLQNADFEAEQTRVARARVHSEQQAVDAPQQLADAEQQLAERLRFLHTAEVQQRASISLADRFENVLDVGRELASALAADAVFAGVEDSATKLLRCEKATVIPLTSRPVPSEIESGTVLSEQIQIPENCAHWSGLVNAAVTSRRAIVGDEETAPDVSGPHSGRVQEEMLSALCVPIFVRGLPVACLHAGHTKLQHMFGEDERRLADFIAVIAGAALENAHGFHQLQELNSTLEERIKERTAAAEFRAAELHRVASVLKKTEERLRVAKDSAESANRAKSDFLANMSHEIRTPMNAILGFTDILRRGYDTSADERQEYLDTIHSSGRHLLHLINGILDLSKVESGRLELESTVCDPQELVQQTLKSLAVRADEKSLSLDFEAEDNLPARIVTDPVRLRQVLTNLVGNSLKFTETGGVTVRAKCVPGETADDAGQLVFDVQDTGIGMDAATQQRIFDPFQQADTSITRRYGGTGLGLAISRKLARALGGDITVTSAPGEGSCFTLCIRLELPDHEHAVSDHAEANTNADASDALSSPAETLHEDAGTESVTLPAARILLVDDGEANRKLLELVLRRAGLTVDSAEDGHQAVDRALAVDYDAVLMDMQMPVMDGYTATEQLRAAGLTMPVVALTANVMRGDEEKCRAAGCSEFLPKPVNIDDLMRLLARLLSEEPATAVCTPVSQQLQSSTSTVDDRSAMSHAESVSVLDDDDGLHGRLPTAFPAISESSILRSISGFGALLDQEFRRLQQAWTDERLDDVQHIATAIRDAANSVDLDDAVNAAESLLSGLAEQNHETIEAAMTELDELCRLLTGSFLKIGTEPAPPLLHPAMALPVSAQPEPSPHVPLADAAVSVSAPTIDPETNIAADSLHLPDGPENAEPLRSTLPLDDPEFREIVAGFVTRLGQQLQAMHAACEREDWQELKALAHWLKGAAGTVGFPDFTEPAGHLETTCNGDSAEAAFAGVARLQALFDRIEMPAG